MTPCSSQLIPAIEYEAASVLGDEEELRDACQWQRSLGGLGRRFYGWHERVHHS